MSNEIHSELKKEFQLERMILFSDAVFAISITLLVIELKIPEIPENLLSERALSESLSHLVPKFIGFLISFMIVGLYWTVHHRMFGFVTNYNQRLLWLNLIFLMAVALMPFSTGFYSEYVFRLLKSPVIVYVTNISFLGLMNFVLWKYISDPKRKLTEGAFKTGSTLLRIPGACSSDNFLCYGAGIFLYTEVCYPDPNGCSAGNGCNI